MKNTWQILIVAIAGLAFSVAARLIHYDQSLWCDEMGIPDVYAPAGWGEIIAGGAGDYTPNNHVLHTVLTKIILGFAGHQPVDRMARLIRLPSLVAGSLIPLALAWPFRRRAPLLAILLLLFAIVQPWLITFSDEARGYALMTLLGIVTTGLVPDGRSRWPIAYAMVVALMIYTVPVAGMLVIAQGLTVMILRPAARRAWLRGALLGGGVALLLFLPMVRGIWYYMQHPQPAPDSFVNFANRLPRLVLAGEYLPVEIDPASHAGDPSWGIICWAMPVLVLIAGSVCGRRVRVLRLPMMAMGLATLLFIFVAMLFPGAGQERFVPWCAIWLVMSVAAIALDIHRRGGTPAMLCVILPVLAWFTYRTIVLLPSQPIREAIEQADIMAPPNTDISVGFLAAADSVRLYGQNATRHRVLATPNPGIFLETEQQDRRINGHAPWLIVSYEMMVRDMVPRFWQYIQANYELKARVPGRISPMGIYAPRYP